MIINRFNAKLHYFSHPGHSLGGLPPGCAALLAQIDQKSLSTPFSITAAEFYRLKKSDISSELNQRLPETTHSFSALCASKKTQSQPTPRIEASVLSEDIREAIDYLAYLSEPWQKEERKHLVRSVALTPIQLSRPELSTSAPQQLHAAWKLEEIANVVSQLLLPIRA